jgi:hypothetical protein
MVQDIKILLTVQSRTGAERAVTFNTAGTVKVLNASIARCGYPEALVHNLTFDHEVLDDTRMIDSYHNIHGGDCLVFVPNIADDGKLSMPDGVQLTHTPDSGVADIGRRTYWLLRACLLHHHRLCLSEKLESRRLWGGSTTVERPTEP